MPDEHFIYYYYVIYFFTLIAHVVCFLIYPCFIVNLDIRPLIKHLKIYSFFFNTIFLLKFYVEVLVNWLIVRYG